MSFFLFLMVAVFCFFLFYRQFLYSPRLARLIDLPPADVIVELDSARSAAEAQIEDNEAAAVRAKQQTKAIRSRL